jgi:hypothetical protein
MKEENREQARAMERKTGLRCSQVSRDICLKKEEIHIIFYLTVSIFETWTKTQVESATNSQRERSGEIDRNERERTGREGGKARERDKERWRERGRERQTETETEGERDRDRAIDTDKDTDIMR